MTVNHTELRKLAQAAKQGPWFPRATDDASFMNARYVGLDEGPGFVHDGANGMALGEVDSKRVIAITLLQEPRLADCDECDENTEFIAAANPTTVLALLDEIERLRELLRVADVALKLDDTLEKANEDEIAALRSRVVEMEGALQDLATATDNATYDGRTHTCVGGGLPCSGCERGERARLRAIESVKSARAALRKPEGG